MTHPISLPLPFGRRLRAIRLTCVTDILATRRQRAALANLDNTRLDDIGITPDAARTEANRPFWDVPDHWRC